MTEIPQLVDADFLEAAEASGLVQTLDGGVAVMGPVDDAATGERLCMVEYCDPALIGNDGGESVAETAAELAPDATRVVLRLPWTHQPDRRWTRMLTYLLHDCESEQNAVEVMPTHATVRRATGRDDTAVRAWLVLALTDGHRGQGRFERERIEAGADAIMADPERVSLVAEFGGEVVGHVTLLADQRDEVTGVRFVDLVDTLVIPGAPRPVSALLVERAQQIARTASLPLRGNVVHAQGNAVRDRGTGGPIVEKLLTRGWRADHCLWIRPLPLVRERSSMRAGQ
jgi:hypothetical protein